MIPALWYAICTAIEAIPPLDGAAGTLQRSPLSQVKDELL